MLDFQAQSNPSLLQHACYAKDHRGSVTGASQYNNIVCDASCNNLECNYDGGDCTQSQILAHCSSQTAALTFTPAQRSTSYDVPPNRRINTQQTQNGNVTTSPNYVTAALVPVNFQIDLTEKLRLLLDGEFNEIVLLQAFKYYLQWEDERIFGHPCFGALQQDLSIPRAAAESETARHQKWTQASRFWMPSLELPGKAAGTSTWDDVADVQLLQSHPWRGNIGPNWASRPVNPVSMQGPVNASGIVYPSTSSAGNSTQMCTSCIMREAEKEVKVLMSTFDYYFYPFDVQTVQMEFEVPGADLFTCESMNPVRYSGGLMDLDGSILSVGALGSALLPGNAAWSLAGTQVSTIFFNHPRDSNGMVQRSRCVLNILLKRQFMVFVVKAMFTTVLVVVGSLVCAMLMNPEELVGDRFAVLFIAFLILVTNMQTDLGIGKVSALLWIDCFNLIQLAMVLVAVGESLYVHYYFKTNRPALAVNLDQVLRKAIILGLYPITTLSTALWGVEQYATCPHSNVCGAAATSSTFSGRDKSLLYASIFVGTLGNSVVVYLSIIYLNRRMKELRLNKKRAAVRVMLTLTSDGFAPKEHVGLDEKSSPSVTEKQMRSLKRSMSSLSRESFKGLGSAVVKDVSKGAVRDVMAAVGFTGPSVSLQKKLQQDSVIVESNYNSFVSAVDESFDYFDLDDGGSVDFSEFREFIAQAYPVSTQALVREVLNKLRTLTDSAGELDQDNFRDSVVILVDFMASIYHSGEVAARNLVQIYAEEEPFGAHTVEAILHFFDHDDPLHQKKRSSSVSGPSGRRSVVETLFTMAGVDGLPGRFAMRVNSPPPPGVRRGPSGMQETFTSDDDASAVEDSTLPKTIRSQTLTDVGSETTAKPSTKPFNLNLLKFPSSPDVEHVEMSARPKVYHDSEEVSVLMLTSAPGGVHVGKVVGNRIPLSVRERFSEVIDDPGRPAKTDKSKRTLSSLLALLRSIGFTQDSHTTVVTPQSPLPVHCFVFSLQPAAGSSGAAPPAADKPATEQRQHQEVGAASAGHQEVGAASAGQAAKAAAAELSKSISRDISSVSDKRADELAEDSEKEGMSRYL